MKSVVLLFVFLSLVACSQNTVVGTWAGQIGNGSIVLEIEESNRCILSIGSSWEQLGSECTFSFIGNNEYLVTAEGESTAKFNYKERSSFMMFKLLDEKVIRLERM